MRGMLAVLLDAMADWLRRAWACTYARIGAADLDADYRDLCEGRPPRAIPRHPMGGDGR